MFRDRNCEIVTVLLINTSVVHHLAPGWYCPDTKQLWLHRRTLREVLFHVAARQCAVLKSTRASDDFWFYCPYTKCTWYTDRKYLAVDTGGVTRIRCQFASSVSKPVPPVTDRFPRSSQLTSARCGSQLQTQHATGHVK